MNPPPKPNIPAFSLRADLPSLCLLMAVIAFAWIGANSKWTAADWHLPGAYLQPRESDVIGMLATFKAAADGHYVPLGIKRVPELGAPGSAEWADIPVVEEMPVYLTGLLARVVGLFAALNMKLLLGHLLAGATFFLVARSLRCTREWAFAGALAFGLAPYIFSESPHHSVVAYVWHLPLFLLVWKWVSSPGEIPLGGRRFWFAVAVAFVTGLQNIYYTNIFCQITLLGGAFAAVRVRQWRPLLISCAIIAGAALAFALMNADTWIYRLREGPNPAAILRPYHWLEIYALKPVDLFIPLATHRIGEFSQFAIEHAKRVALVNEGSYLGIAGIFSLAWLVFVSARGVIMRSHVPAAFWQVFWIFAVFITGGLNSFAGAVGFTFFRAGYRAGIVILVIVLMFAAMRASALLAARHRLSMLLVLLATAVVLADQVPRTLSPGARAGIALQVESDREFVRAIERALPPDAMIFQLPVMDFPESPAPGLTPYEHLRPYIHSRSLRFSFGGVKGRSNRMNLDPEENPGGFLEFMRNAGFQGILINRRGYPDGAAGLSNALQSVGLGEPAPSKTGDLMFFNLE